MTLEQLFVSRAQCFAYQPTGKIPDPPVFSVDGLKYTVPPYYSFHHSETQWLVNMIKTNNWSRIHRIICTNEFYLTNTYCQYPDSPDPILGQPMFHRKAILYLTPLALAIYLRQYKLATKMMEFVTVMKVRVVNVNQPCFVTNYLERFENRNDIMVIYPFCIMFKRECFECIKPLLNNGWCPQEEIELPYRRIGQVFVFHYKDIIEYCLSQMVTRPNLRLPRMLQQLITAGHNNFTLLNFENVIIKDGDDTETEDFVSIPRRLLRYIHYYDRDMRIVSQVVSSLRVVQQLGFYVGPRRDLSEITLLPPKIGTDEDNMINDQDNSIALILGICEEADTKGHFQSRLKLLDVLVHILVDTKWLINFLQWDSTTIADYFSNLTEKINPINALTIATVRQHSRTLIDIAEINVKEIKELFDPENPTKHWKENWDLYLERSSLDCSKNNTFFKFNIEEDNEAKDSESIFSDISVINAVEASKCDVYLGPDFNQS